MGYHGGYNAGGYPPGEDPYDAGYVVGADDFYGGNEDDEPYDGPGSNNGGEIDETDNMRMAWEEMVDSDVDEPARPKDDTPGVRLNGTSQGGPNDLPPEDWIDAELIRFRTKGEHYFFT
jgi:hypothetical protein